MLKRYETKLDYLEFLILTHKDHQKTIAANIDMSPSTLSRKIRRNEGDCQRFTLDDEDKLYKAYPDIAQKMIEYEVCKWWDTPENKQQRALDEATRLMQELIQVCPQLPQLLQAKGVQP